jgi:hypothetical protein
VGWLTLEIEKNEKGRLDNGYEDRQTNRHIGRQADREKYTKWKIKKRKRNGVGVNMEKLELKGQSLGQVFNSSGGCGPGIHYLFCYEAKVAGLELSSLPLEIVLPDVSAIWQREREREREREESHTQRQADRQTHTHTCIQTGGQTERERGWTDGRT